MKTVNRKVRILVDAMGGDYAPGEIVKGAVLAAEKNDIEVILVGPVDTLAAELAKYNSSTPSLRCIRADEFVKENEASSLSAPRRSDTSLTVAARTLKAGEADALISAGPTVALVGSALRYLGTIDGIERPVLGGALATFAPKTVMMDCGVNVDCKPYHLLTFAIMGSIYAKKFLNIDNPTIALLNIGAEENKGSRVLRETYPLLQKSGLNFIGNIEGNEILSGKANVIVCDGLVGNIMFKFSESGLDIINQWLRKKLKFLPLLGLYKLLARDLISLTRVPENAGNGLIWGVNGVVLKMHGASRAPAVAEKIAQAKLVVEMNVLGSLEAELAAMKSKLKF